MDDDQVSEAARRRRRSAVTVPAVLLALGQGPPLVLPVGLSAGREPLTTEAAVFRVHGPGALTCLQGLLTNDLVKPGDNSLVYGALLTPKGAVVVDYWVLRQPEAITLVAPRSGHEASLDLFRRQLPPRLARVTDMTGHARAAWLIGAHGFQTLALSGVRVPEATGRVASVGGEVSPVALALAPENAPFVALAVGAEPAVAALSAKLVAAGAVAGDERDLHAARILCGWPALGAEIDERTLPQEVRYDQIGGVSYTKGCYTGQETVARLHFRGHTNRELRGLRWRRPQPLDSRSIQKGEREVAEAAAVGDLGERAPPVQPSRTHAC